jgi:hypothetical protein
MRNRKLWILAVLSGLFAWQTMAISLCEYSQPITSVTTSSLQVNFRYLDDEFRDDRGNVLSLTLAGSFLRYYDSADFGYGVNANGSVSNHNGTWNLAGAGSVDFGSTRRGWMCSRLAG